MSKVPFEKPYLRHLFLKHKAFLRKVFLSKNKETKELILEASDNEINILIKIVYLIIHEAIPIKNGVVKSISPAKKKFLVTFNKNHGKVSNILLKSPLNEKKTYLLKFVQWIPKFLVPLFHRGPLFHHG